MRAFVASRSVAVSEDDIDSFASRWPCCNLRGLRGVTFQFEENGDLVDIHYRNGDSDRSDRWDGEALVALSLDAQAYLSKRTPPPPSPHLGKRVELHPGCDLWMRGAKYGTVHSVMPDGTLKIRMDNERVRKLQRLPLDRVTFRGPHDTGG